MKSAIASLLAICLIVAGLAMSACGTGPDKSREDAGDTVNVDKSTPHSTAFNNHFPNVEDKCDGHGHRVYVTTAKTFAIVPDPSCPGYQENTGNAIAVRGG